MAGGRLWLILLSDLRQKEEVTSFERHLSRICLLWWAGKQGPGCGSEADPGLRGKAPESLALVETTSKEVPPGEVSGKPWDGDAWGSWDYFLLALAWDGSSFQIT